LSAIGAMKCVCVAVTILAFFRLSFADCDCTIVPFKPDPPCFQKCAGKILSEASVTQLTTIMGLDSALAQKIVAWRSGESRRLFDWYKSRLTPREVVVLETAFKNLTPEQTYALARSIETGTSGAANLDLGTWKLNEAASTFAPRIGRSQTVVYKQAWGKVKITTDGVTPEGKATHTEWVGKYDGRDYPVTGDSNVDARSYYKLDDRTFAVTLKKAGKVVASSRVVISADGKTRTVTTIGTTAEGKKLKNITVYDKSD